MKGLRLVTAPVEEPIQIEQAKDHLRITGDDENSLLTGYIVAAREFAEDYTNRKLLSQTWELRLEAFPIANYGEIRLPFGKTISVDDISYYDTDGTLQSLAGPSSSPVGTAWLEDLNDDAGGILRHPLASVWPSVHPGVPIPVSISYTCGYGDDANDVPENIKTAILYRVADLFELRGSGDGEMSQVAERLLRPYVIESV